MNATARLVTSILVSVGIALTVLSIILLVRDLSIYPAVGNDEWWFSARLDRYVHLGDYSDRVAFDSFADHGVYAKNPPANFLLRKLVHGVIGLGAEAARPISVAQFLVLGVCTGLVARRYGASWALVALAVPFLTLVPISAYTARTFRFEQDIVFFGWLSVLLVLLSPSGRTMRLLSAAAGGFFAGMASMMHLHGVPFGAGIALYGVALAIRGGNRRLDWLVGVCWCAAASVPVIATGLYYLGDLSNAVEYFAGFRAYEAVQFVDRDHELAAMFPNPGLPTRLLLVLNAARGGLLILEPGPSTGTIGTILQVMWGGCALLLLGAAVQSGVKLRRDAGSAGSARRRISLVLGMGAAVAIGALLIRPNPYYTVYFWLLVALAAYFGVALWRPDTGPRTLAARWGVATFVVLLQAGYLSSLVFGNAEPVSGAMLGQIRAMRHLSESVGLQPLNADGPPVYTDSVSWAAGGRLAPLFEYLIADVAPLRPDYAGAVFSLRWYGTFTQLITTFSGRPIDVPHRVNVLSEMLDGLAFAGVLEVEDGPTRLWYVRQAATDPVFMRIARDGTTSRWTGHLRMASELSVPAGQSHPVERLALGTGRYFARLDGDVLDVSYLTLVVGGQPVAKSEIVSGFPQKHGGPYLWVNPASAEDAEVVIESHARVAGTIRLRVWQLIDAP